MQEQAQKHLFDYLLNISNGKLQLTPKQLEKVINISSKQQSILRQKNKFPIKYIVIGRLVFYPITAIIDYLLNYEEKEIVQQEVKTVQQPQVVKKRQSKQVDDLSYLFTMRALMTNIDEEFERISYLKDFLHKFVKIKEEYFELQQYLSCKNTTQKKIGKL